MNELSDFEQWEIKSYFRIDERIQRIKDGIKRLTTFFYNQTLSSYTVWNGYEGMIVGFRVESKVVPFVDTIENMNQRIDRLSKKKRYFDDYLDSLPPEEKEYLIDKYTLEESPFLEIQQEDLDLLDEIHEIETAICYMYGFPVEQPPVKINNDFLDDDFSNIAALIGVE